jgi:hypothetical protein
MHISVPLEFNHRYIYVLSQLTRHENCASQMYNFSGFLLLFIAIECLHDLIEVLNEEPDRGQVAS